MKTNLKMSKKLDIQKNITGHVTYYESNMLLLILFSSNSFHEACMKNLIYDMMKIKEISC